MRGGKSEGGYGTTGMRVSFFYRGSRECEMVKREGGRRKEGRKGGMTVWRGEGSEGRERKENGKAISNKQRQRGQRMKSSQITLRGAMI